MTSFDIIFRSGSAWILIHEASRSMRERMSEEIEEKLRQTNEKTPCVHQPQTQLLKKYASGTKMEMGIIMVHAQDHLMTMMTLPEVAQEMDYSY